MYEIVDWDDVNCKEFVVDFYSVLMENPVIEVRGVAR